MNKPLKFSIITVCLNAEKTIEKAIRSTNSQIYPHIEHIIIDGSSTDKTLEIIRKNSQNSTKIISEIDHGIFDAMNKGIGLSSGEILYFLNSDDALYDDRVIFDMAKIFNEDNSRMLAYGDVELKDAPPGLKIPLAKDFKNRSISEFLHNSFCHQAIFARKSLFTKIGTFELKYKYAADYVWVAKAFKFDPGGFFYTNRKIAYFSYAGQSYQHAVAARREGMEGLFKHLFSLELVWFYIRYRLLRGLKKKILNEE